MARHGSLLGLCWGAGGAIGMLQPRGQEVGMSSWGEVIGGLRDTSGVTARGPPWRGVRVHWPGTAASWGFAGALVGPQGYYSRRARRWG